MTGKGRPRKETFEVGPEGRGRASGALGDILPSQIDQLSQRKR